jgi:CDP-glucose 4,6-dehydratase
MKELQSLLHQTYSGKKIFLTGHTGFKGSWLLYWLNVLGAQIKGYSLEPQQKDALYYAIGGASLCESVIADILDKERLDKEILQFQPDFIFHLAAQPLVRLSYDKPSETFAVNALGTAFVLDAMRAMDKPCTGVIITTDKVYENREWVYPYRENEALGGYDPYSASKACAELIISSYRSSFFNPGDYERHSKAVASARAGNVIGGGDWAKDRIIPDIVRALMNNVGVVIRNPSAVRPWQHVLEPLAGYLELGARLMENPTKFSDAWNFGPHAEDNKTVEDLVKQALLIWGTGEYRKSSLTGQPHEAGLLKLDINKAISSMLWRPKMKSEEAIEVTIGWYKSVLSGRKAADVLEQDLQRFLALA